MAKLRADNLERDIKERVRGFCELAETCPHMSRTECTKCIQYYIACFPKH